MKIEIDLSDNEAFQNAVKEEATRRVLTLLDSGETIFPQEAGNLYFNVENASPSRTENLQSQPISLSAAFDWDRNATDDYKGGLLDWAKFLEDEAAKYRAKHAELVKEWGE